MNTGKTICISLLILTGILSGARGEDYRTDINPALLYYQAFLVAPKNEDIRYLDTNNWLKSFGEGQPLPDTFGSVVTKFSPELELVRQAAHQTVPCDWGIDLSRGADTLLPQLDRAKRASFDSEYQMMWDLQNGNQAGARDDLLASLALGRNISQNHTLISALVQMAIESFVCGQISQNFHRFTPETLQQLADGIDAAPPRGTVAGCVSTEESFSRGYLKSFEQLKEQFPDTNASAMDALHDHLLKYFTLEQWEQLTNGTGGTIDGIIRSFEAYEPLFARLGKIMALPYAEYEGRFKYESQPALLTAQFEKSVNPFFVQLIPEWQRCRSREFQTEVNLAMVRAAIEYKLHGEAGLNSVADPCGNGPFTLQHVDGGFELKSQLTKSVGSKRSPVNRLFVETNGPAFDPTETGSGEPPRNK